jgi:hypothetical protein
MGWDDDRKAEAVAKLKRIQDELSEMVGRRLLQHEVVSAFDTTRGTWIKHSYLMTRPSRLATVARNLGLAEDTVIYRFGNASEVEFYRRMNTGLSGSPTPPAR